MIMIIIMIMVMNVEYIGLIETGCPLQDGGIFGKVPKGGIFNPKFMLHILAFYSTPSTEGVEST